MDNTTISVIIYMLVVILSALVYSFLKCLSLRGAKGLLFMIQIFIVMIFVLPLLKESEIGFDQIAMIVNFEFMWFGFYFLIYKRDLKQIELYNFLNNSNLNFVFSSELEKIEDKDYISFINCLNDLETSITSDFTKKNFSTIVYNEEEKEIEVNVIVWGNNRELDLFDNNAKYKVTTESFLRGVSYNFIIHSQNHSNRET